jgi:hypothetical protein
VVSSVVGFSTHLAVQPTSILAVLLTPMDLGMHWISSLECTIFAEILASMLNFSVPASHDVRQT